MKVTKKTTEKINKEYLKILIDTETPTILDIGCYDGQDSLELAELFKKPTIYCFEPDQRSLELFNKLIKKDRRIKLISKVVSNIDGKVELYQSSSPKRNHPSASSSIKQPKNILTIFPDIEYNKPIITNSIKLDTWAKKNNINKIDLMWVDVNGAEKEVIEGAKNILNYTRFLFIEFSNKELWAGQINKKELISLLPNFKELGIYNYLGNYGDILLRNKNYE